MRAFADFLVRLRKEKPLAVGLSVILLLLILVALLADVLAPFAPNEVFLMDRLQGSSVRYPLGTDQLGRDFASRLIYGARLTLGVGLAATAVNVLVALVVGGVSGFIGGRLDLTVQRFVDAWMSIPGLLILLTVMSVVGRGVLQIIVVLGVLGGIGASRVVRGAVIGAKENVYFEAARAVGSSRWRTLLHHLLPNIAPVLIVIYSINIGAVVISEASLSFLGFGLPTTVPSWGGMLSREGRQYMEIAPRLAVWPGLCLTVVVYCLNMVGDAVRDLLDPRLRGGGGRLGAYGAQAVRNGSVGLGRAAPDMKLLLDTHIWVWSVADESRLTDTVRRTLDDPAHERWISAISIWEVLILAERGRLILEPDARSWVRQALADAPLREAPVTIDVALASRGVRLRNQDPADRFIAASAMVFGMTLVTADGDLCDCPDIDVLPNTG